MTKLNYTARKISGIKAGKALKKDLKKRIPLSSSTRPRDPVLEIDISGKDLGDDGFHEFIFDLRVALEYKTADFPQGVNKLHELHLQGNNLTCDSLVELAKVIQLASKDLKELDLSNNRINIVENTDVTKWQYFLLSFSQCCVLKKVDFSGNLLRSRGVEALARIYIRSELDFVDIEESDPEDSDSAVYDTEFSSPGVVIASRRRGPQLTTSTSKGYSETEIRRFACTRGLRSVPYILLQNVGMTNGGIIHVAEMLKLHRTPEHLLSFLPTGKLPSLPADSAETSLRGIHWLPNDGLSPLSIRLMKLTSQLQQSSADSDSGEDDMADEFGDMTLDEDDLDLFERRKRRQKLNVQLTRVMKLHRIDVLGSEGMLKSEIWHGALRMLAVGRAILLDDKNRPPSVEEELRVSRRARAEAEGREETKSLRASPATPRPPRVMPIPAIQTQLEQRVARATNRMQAPPGVMISTFRFDPESETFDIMFPAMHTPSTHPILQARAPPVAVAMPEYPSPLAQVSVPEPEPQQKHGSGSTTPNNRANNNGSGSTHLQQEKYRFGLPLHLWAKILPQAIGVHRVLHPDQVMKILQYAASWNALAAEVSINGAPEHQQIWKILDSMDCFAYKPLS